MSRPVPDWARDAVFYQVFPDRFAASSRVAKPGPLETWATPPTVHGYKGGDLLGVVERLDELVDLGVTALYLNPIFAAASNHRYNTYDYLAVDPLLGGEPALRTLVDTLHERGLRVILDGVFNHVGRGFWPFHHVVESGAASPYREWFYLDQDVLAGRRMVAAEDHLCPEQGPRGYRSWWDVPSLPKLRIENPVVRAYLLDAVERWMRFGIDGWRLDVPADIEDRTFWPEFRDRVRAINPEAYLVGEIWHEAPDWLTGDRFDAVMNYPLGLAILGFAGGSHLDHAMFAGQPDYRASLHELDGAAFADRLARTLAIYDPDTVAVQFNLIGSHDTPRARTVLGDDPLRLRLAQLLQLTLPGAPSIYYGDELGMRGGIDPDCRRAYPASLDALDAAAREHRAFVRATVHARRAHPALGRGDVSPVGLAGPAIALERTAGDRRAIVAVNAGDGPIDLTLPAGTLDGLRRLDALAVGTSEVRPDGSAIAMGACSAVVLVSD
jgi:cyclomaltodextrinase